MPGSQFVACFISTLQRITNMVGNNISHYKILEKLGEGGMGVVYKALDTRLERTVAVKLLPRHLTASARDLERFRQEARTAAALDHPNICTIHEIDESGDDGLFISMAYYEGTTLQKRLKDGALTFPEALDIAIQLAKGLQCAHESQIIHRDIKPGNVMLTRRGEVKIVDFGLAKLAGQSHLTQSGTTLGTAAYMSPEQISNSEVDERSDIFSFGLMLYEMFTGVHPFRSDYYHAIMYAILHDDPKPVTEINPELPEELQWIIEKAIRKNPDDRYKSIKDMVVLLEALKEGTISHSNMAGDYLPHRQTTPATSPGRTKTVKIALAGLAAILFVVFLVLYLSDSVPLSPSGFSTPPELPELKQIAVLPFLNVGGDPENQVFMDGLVEILTSKLSQLEQFHGSYLVVPASETRSSGITSASAARDAFGVNLVVTGSVQQLNRGVRVTLNLIDARTLRQIDSRTIDDPFIEKSVLQDEAVFHLAGMLNLELQPEARQIIAAGRTEEPGAYEFYLRGLGHLQRFDRIEEINAAISLFRRALEIDPDYALALAALGDAHLYLFRSTQDVKWIEPAIEYSRKAALMDDRLSPVHTTLGLLYIETGDYEKAHRELQRALEINPSNFEAYRGRARAFMSQQRTNEAEATYRRAIAMKPDYWAGYAELGVFYSGRGRYEEAATQFRNVIDLTPNNASAYRNLGAVYYYLDRREEAIEAFNKSVEIRPDYSAYSNLGTLYYYDGDFNAAAEMYSRALELNDADYLVWSYLASASKQSSPPDLDRWESALQRAKEIAEKRLEINPRDITLLLSLAAYSLDLDTVEKAQEYLGQALALKPSDLNNMMRIGTIYERLGERTKAIEWIEKAVKAGYPLEEIYSTPILKDLRRDKRFSHMSQK